jgi:iron uptake system component EfeO
MIERRSHARKLTAVVALAGTAALGLAACGSSGSSSGGSAATAGATKLTVTLTDQGCSPARLTAPTGPITFALEGASAAVTEMELKNGDGIILGERENVAQGLSSSFTLELEPGRYVTSCPNGDKGDNGVLVVTGKANDAGATPASAAVAKATDGYRGFVSDESETLLRDTRAFVAALKSGDLGKAKALFGPTRIHYETIEPVAESFGDLDPEIDARVNDVDDRSRWTGFHRIERILWVENTTEGTERYADKLLRDVETLTTKVKSLRFQAPQLANGAVELLNEVANAKITGEEDRYSHTDLSDFQGNLDGARKAFELLAPVLRARGDGALVKQLDARFADVEKSLAAYRRSTPLGFAVYSELTPRDRRKLAQQVDALAEPLSTVAAKVTA